MNRDPVYASFRSQRTGRWSGYMLVVFPSRGQVRRELARMEARLP